MDHRRKAQKRKPPRRVPHRVIQKMKSAIKEIDQLNPTCEEIVKYAKANER